MSDKVSRCPECNSIEVKGKTCLHEFKCKFNNLNKEEWDALKSARDAKFAAFIYNEIANSNIVDEMSYRDMADYLINNLWGNQKIGSLDEAVLTKTIDILLAIQQHAIVIPEFKYDEE